MKSAPTVYATGRVPLPGLHLTCTGCAWTHDIAWTEPEQGPIDWEAVKKEVGRVSQTHLETHVTDEEPNDSRE